MPKHSKAAEGLLEYRSVEKKKLKVCMLITGVVMLAEVVGGFLTNSLALISDAGHMFTHFFALAISFGAILCASIKSCHHRTFGFYRAEVLAALFNSIFLFVVAALIIIEGVKRIIHPQDILSSQMFVVAVIGLIANLVTAWILHDASKDDMNIKGAFLHMMGDTLSSVFIVIGALVIHSTGLRIIDPILSIVVALIILVWGFGLFRDSIDILLEGAPKGINSDDVSKILMKEISQIQKISDMHIWTITSKMYSMTMHLRLNKLLEKEEVKKTLNRIKKIANDHFDIEHTTIELE